MYAFACINVIPSRPPVPFYETLYVSTYLGITTNTSLPTKLQTIKPPSNNEHAADYSASDKENKQNSYAPPYVPPSYPPVTIIKSIREPKSELVLIPEKTKGRAGIC